MTDKFIVDSEFVKQLHNFRCELYGDYPELEKKFSAIISKLTEERDAILDRRADYYRDMSEAYKLYSIWSIYEQDSLQATSPFKGNRMFFSGYNKNLDTNLPIKPLTWLELWKAADKLIREDNSNHVFIEGFIQRDDNTIELITGS